MRARPGDPGHINTPVYTGCPLRPISSGHRGQSPQNIRRIRWPEPAIQGPGRSGRWPDPSCDGFERPGGPTRAVTGSGKGVILKSFSIYAHCTKSRKPSHFADSDGSFWPATLGPNVVQIFAFFILQKFKLPSLLVSPRLELGICRV